MNRQGRRFHGSADVTSVPLGQDRAGIGLFNSLHQAVSDQRDER